MLLNKDIVAHAKLQCKDLTTKQNKVLTSKISNRGEGLLKFG
jgi:hypothetical protein